MIQVKKLGKMEQKELEARRMFLLEAIPQAPVLRRLSLIQERIEVDRRLGLRR